MNPPFDMEHRLIEIDSSRRLFDSRLECLQRLLTSSPTEETGRLFERVKQLRSAIERINPHGTSHTAIANLHDRVELLRSQCDQLEIDAIVSEREREKESLLLTQWHQLNKHSRASETC